MLVIFLTCSTGVFTGSACWCWRMAFWTELGEVRLDDKVFINHTGWSQKRKRNQSRFPASELGLRLRGKISGALEDVWVIFTPFFSFGGAALRVSQSCFLELESGTRQQLGG